MDHTVRIAIITTIPATTYYFMVESIALLKARGHTVFLLCGDDAWVTPEQLRERFDVPVHVVPLKRSIAPQSDLRALFALRRKLRTLRVDIVHYSTPKAALFGALAAWSAGVRRRVYANRGLLAADAPGLRGALWRAVERSICRLSHAVTCNSESNRTFMVENGICPPEKVRVIGSGSSHGVDAEGRFDPARFAGAGESMPSILNHQSSIVTLLFVGRLAADKGFAQLAAAWARVREELAEARLLIVGPEAEPCNAVAREQMEALRVDPRVEFTGPREDVERCYAAADIVVLPSYREGFPNVALEAAAMELPVITTDALGCVDSVKNGETGIVVPVRDAGALAGAMIALGREAQLRARMGAAGREWVLKEFSPRVIAEGLVRLLTGQAGAVQLSATVWKPGQGG